MGYMPSSRWVPADGHVFRARGAGFYSVLVALIVVPVILSAFWPVTVRTPAIVVTALAGGYWGWVFFWRPHLVVAPAQITIVNSWETHRVPWEALIDVQTHRELTLVTPQGRYAAQAAPAPGGRAALRAAMKDRGPAPSERATTDSGAAAKVIRAHWQELVEDGVLDHDDPEKVPASRLDTAVLAVGLALLIASTAAWVLL